jgi:alanine dehydrogenase
MMAEEGVAGAVRSHPELAAGVNIVGDKVCHPAVASSLGVDHVPALEALAGW